MVGQEVLIGDVPATELAARFGTPLYAYDADSIRRRFGLLTGGIAYEPLQIYYSGKANAAIGILRLLRTLGANVDACSPGDIVAATRAGFTDGISYVGIGASDADLDAVVASRAFFIADSTGQLDRYADREPDSTEIGLRVNPGVQARSQALVRAGSWDAKFGIHPSEIHAAVGQARARGLRVVGLHAHVGSDLSTSEPHLATLELLLTLGEDLGGLRFVSLGGGFAVAAEGVPDYPVAEFGTSAAELLHEFERRTGRHLELRLEPGGYLVMDSGVLLTAVTDIKPAVRLNGRMTPKFVCVDSSYNHVVSAVLHDTTHPVELARDRSTPPGSPTIVTVVGNLMQAGDIIARDRPLPDLVVGDVLVVRRCGGYTSSRATTFNERPRPAEVLVDGDRIGLLRRGETLDDLFARDVWHD